MPRAAWAALGLAFALGAGAADLAGPMSSTPQPAGASAGTAAADNAEPVDVKKLFANTCGWCHSSGGREAGRGPKLMDTRLTDAEIATRIKTGKQGAMPAFGASFDDHQIAAIVRYIRELKPEAGAQ
jgi:mono/diheme cytochrome c family protein